MGYKLLFVLGFVFLSGTLYAQKSFYSIIQLGGQFGFANEGYTGSFNGYSGHFIFGQNFGEQLFLGLGLGNETFSGSYRTNDPHHSDQTERDYKAYMLPIFVDGRLPIGHFGNSSRIGLLVNGGYAPRVGVGYDKGFLFKGGFFYLYETGSRTNYTASATYGYQQLTHNNHDPSRDFQHQHFNISVGLMFK